MKTFKKLFAYSAIFALLATMMPTYANAASYSDELTEAYGYAKNKGITTMASIDDADMYGNLTRVAMAKMVANYVLDLGLQELDTTKECKFPDVSVALDTAYDNGVTKACQLGLMGVGITKFNPNGIVTRAEFGTVLSRALWGDENNGGDPYYKKHLQALKDEGIMNMIDNPNMKEVRGYVMLMMMRADDNYAPAVGCSAEELLTCILADDYEACIAACSDETTEVLPGYARVSRVGSATNQAIAFNAVHKKIGTIKLTAGENDTTVSSIVISKSGLGLGKITFELFRNGVSVSKVGTMRENKNTATVRLSPALVLKAGSSEILDIEASFDENTTENSYFNFSVSAVNVANGSSSGTPVELGSVNTTSYKVAKINTVTVTPGSDQKAGELNKVLATVKIEMPARETKLDGFIITNENTNESLTSLMSNVVAYHNGAKVGNVMVSNEKIIVSDLNIVRSHGESVSIELRNDCVFVGNDYIIDLDINDNDVIAYETSTNERVQSKASDDKIIKFSGIDLAITNLITASQTVAPGTSSVELFKAKITANADFEITDYTITFAKPTGITTGRLNTDFTSVIAYVNDVDYELDLDTETSRLFDHKDSVSISKTSPITVRVVANVRSDATGLSGAYQMNFHATTGKNDNNVDVTISNINTNGHSTTINNGGFSITRQTNTPTNKTVLESNAADMLFFNLRANTEDQVLTGLTVSFTGTEAVLSGIATKAELMKGSGVIKSVTDEAKLGATVTFDGLSEQLKKDVDNYFTVRLTLKGGDVENLGTTGQLSLLTGNVNVARAADIAQATVTKSPNFVGTTYSIASNAPSVEITDQVAKNTSVKFTNNSPYYVKLIDVKLEMTRNEGSNGYTQWGGTGRFLDSINGNIISDQKVIPGEILLTLNTDYQDLDSTLDYVVELFDPENTVNANNYTVTIKGLTYKFVDKVSGSGSTAISETYNATEDK